MHFTNFARFVATSSDALFTAFTSAAFFAYAGFSGCSTAAIPPADLAFEDPHFNADTLMRRALREVL